MARMVLEKSGSCSNGPEQAYADADEIGRQVMSLAKADPPWLEEEPMTLTQHDRDTYTVRAVMNSEKGRRLRT